MCKKFCPNKQRYFQLFMRLDLKRAKSFVLINSFFFFFKPFMRLDLKCAKSFVLINSVTFYFFFIFILTFHAFGS